MSTIRHHMTEHPHTIGSAQPIAEAARRMRQHHVRHLPVLDGGALVGMISDRDVGLAQSIAAEGGTNVPVAEVMSPETFAVAPDADVADVVCQMADRRLGSAVVMEGPKVIGIFTTTDALRMLARAMVVDDMRSDVLEGGVR